MKNQLHKHFQLILSFLIMPMFLALFFAPVANAVSPTQNSWTFVGLSDQSVVSVAVDPTNSDILYAGSQYIGGGPASGVYKSTNKGDTWTPITNGLPTDFPHTAYASLKIDPKNPQIIYVGIIGNRHGGDAQAFEGIYKSTNGGGSWTDITPQGKTTSVLDIAIDPNNSNNIYIAGYHDCNGIWKSTDAGANWILTSHPYCDSTRVVVDPSNSSVLYASNGGYIIKSINAGASWNQILSDTSTGLHGITFDPNNSSTVYAGSQTDGVYKSTNSGATWTLLPGSPRTANSVPSTLIADVNRIDTFYTMSYNSANKTTDSGSSWAGINAGWPGGGYASFSQPSNDPEVLYAGRVSGGVYVYGLPALNRAPVVDTINVSANPIQVNTSITASANFTDAEISDIHSAIWNWGDGSTSSGTITESNGTGSVSNAHTYTTSGIYTITLSVADNNGGTGTKNYEFVSVYDVAAGWATGGKEFTSPVGSVTGNSSATGKADFGFQVKYQNGNMIPSGKNVELSFPAGNIDYVSTGYLWLVVNGTKATFKATGTLNGIPGYTILVSAIDQGSGNPSGLVRAKIIKDSDGSTVYDTQQGAVDSANPLTVVSKGKITVH